MVDDGGEAYMIYTVWQPVGNPKMRTHMSVELLTPDYLGSAMKASAVFSSNVTLSGVEAPALIKRKGVYYALFGHGCCFCKTGSGVNVFTSTTSPLGPWSNSSVDIGCAPVAKGSSVDVRDCASFATAQQTGVFDVATPNGTVQVWHGDRWQSAPDKLKAHDLQYWGVMSWDDSTMPPRPRHLVFEDVFGITLA